MVEGEEALNAEMAAAEDLFVEVGAKFLEVVEAVGHGSSGLRFCHREMLVGEGDEMDVRAVTVSRQTIDA